MDACKRFTGPTPFDVIPMIVSKWHLSFMDRVNSFLWIDEAKRAALDVTRERDSRPLDDRWTLRREALKKKLDDAKNPRRISTTLLPELVEDHRVDRISAEWRRNFPNHGIEKLATKVTTKSGLRETMDDREKKSWWTNEEHLDIVEEGAHRRHKRDFP